MLDKGTAHAWAPRWEPQPASEVRCVQLKHLQVYHTSVGHTQVGTARVPSWRKLHGKLPLRHFQSAEQGCLPAVHNTQESAQVSAFASEATGHRAARPAYLFGQLASSWHQS